MSDANNATVTPDELQAWSHLLRIGKKLKVDASFKFVESGKTARTAARGATAAQLADADVRLDAEQASLDPTGHKHYKLMTHHLKSLVKFVQDGNTLQGHGDVPDNIREQLYAEEHQAADLLAIYDHVKVNVGVQGFSIGLEGVLSLLRHLLRKNDYLAFFRSVKRDIRLPIDGLRPKR
ncbi:hypothetical protein O9K51_10787 [Purpureocillium lavendulum]|uniref:Uncharacterized protein n=1 Tax=Purpureocillium lavendulum TaxID=1247861 RepID=A0AB34FCB7_9HYPO|nr:hypothetical protein O9K51_10787 [Purpureocillium lavendulum]